MPDLRVATAGRCGLDVLRVLVNRPWAELLEGQGCSFVVDLGIGGPSDHYAHRELHTPTCAHGAHLLRLADGYYFDDPSRKTSEEQDRARVLRRMCEEGPVESPFPLAVPCLRSAAAWTDKHEVAEVRQVFFLLWGLRRNYWKAGAELAGAEQAGRDTFIDFADMGLRFEMDAREGVAPPAFCSWLRGLLAE